MYFFTAFLLASYDMKKLLLIILLLIGCTREYTCDRHISCSDDTGAGSEDGSHSYISITVD